ncbi:conjugal transfer protein [Streptomyces diastaticus]|uniref:conjugal transfer protein n=1 Tax=Streptomyces diastaticus TaxID=1956 RepID=UPI00344F50C3
MKILSKQPAPEPAPEAGNEPTAGARDDAHELGGWSTGAQANTTTLVRWVAWAAICGSILLSLGTFLTRPTDTPSSGQQPPAGTGAQGAAGFATLYASEYLLAGKGDEGRLAAYYPGAATLRLEGPRGRLTPSQLTVTRLRQTGPGIWSVTVAARLQPPSPPVEVDDVKGKDSDSPGPDTDTDTDTGADTGADAGPPQGESVRYFQVPVASAPRADGSTGYVAMSLPAEVAGPGTVDGPHTVYGTPQPPHDRDPRVKTIRSFLAAYLAGDGDLDRYLAPRTRLTRIAPAPYTAVDLTSLAADGPAEATPVPPDGTVQRLQVSVRARAADGTTLPLTYALTLKTRAGRWEIASLDGAPEARPAPAPSSP